MVLVIPILLLCDTTVVKHFFSVYTRYVPLKQLSHRIPTESLYLFFFFFIQLFYDIHVHGKPFRYEGEKGRHDGGVLRLPKRQRRVRRREGQGCLILAGLLLSNAITAFHARAPPRFPGALERSRVKYQRRKGE